MRDTDYATEIASVDHEGGRIERLFIKGENREEIRFSWWKDGRMQRRPLDLPEEQLLALMRLAIDDGNIFSASFLEALRAMLSERRGDAQRT